LEAGGAANLANPFSHAYFHPISEMATTDFEVAFPNPELLRGFDPTAGERKCILRPDPSQSILTTDGGSTAVEFRFSSATMRKFMR
jgi:hypothetical protein